MWSIGNVAWLLLNHAPISTQLHPPPLSSTHLHLLPPSSFQHPPSSLQHPQYYYNQNIACNWAISPNSDQKNKSCPFGLKISTHGILEVYTDSRFRLRFLKSQPQNPFLGKFGLKKSKLPLLPDNWHIYKVFQRCWLLFRH